mgnify:CR=1 FL=1
MTKDEEKRAADGEAGGGGGGGTAGDVGEMVRAGERLVGEVFGHAGLREMQRRVVERVFGEVGRWMKGSAAAGDGSADGLGRTDGGSGGGVGGAMVVMPTGSGKSLCYQLPAVALSRLRGGETKSGEGGAGVTLVLSPLIALMEDQVSALKEKGVRAAYVNSTLSRSEREKRYRKLGGGAYEVMYATPERMGKSDFREALERAPGGVHLLAVDEAHCISKWGHDLRPAYREVGRFRRELGEPATVALTATATPAVRDDIRAVLGFGEAELPLFATGIERPNLSLRVEDAWDDRRKDAAIERTALEMEGTGIVYYALIKDLDRAASRLRERLGKEGREVAVYHGRLPAREKRKVYRRFIEARPGDGLVLLATNAFGMGVDKADIRFIVHAQLPGSVEAYYQEVGRAGRDGERSECVLLYCEDDVAIQQQFVEWQNPSAELVWRAAAAIESEYGTGKDVEFDADMVSKEVTGRFGDGRFGYVLTELEHLGVIEVSQLGGYGEVGRGREGGGGERGGRGGERRGGDEAWYRWVRPLREGEVDEAEVEAKRKRDLMRLLEVVKLKDAEDVAARVEAYFEL